MACTTRTSRLNDVAGLADGSRLVQLSEEIGRIARTLATLAERPPTPSMPERVRFAPPQPMTADVAAAAGAQVRGLIRARRTTLGRASGGEGGVGTGRTRGLPLPY